MSPGDTAPQAQRRQVHFIHFIHFLKIYTEKHFLGQNKVLTFHMQWFLTANLTSPCVTFCRFYKAVQN